MASFRPRDIGEWLQVIWRRKLLVLLIVFVVFSSAYLVVADLPNVYQSRAVVLVARNENREADNTRIAKAIQQLVGKANLEAVITKHNLYPPASKNGDFDGATDRMTRAIEIKTRERYDSPESMVVTFKYSDPLLAKEGLASLLSVFDNGNAAIAKQAEEESKAITVQLATMDAQFEALGQQRAAETARNESVKQALNELGAARATRQVTVASIESLTDKQLLLERQIENQKQQLLDQEKIVNSAVSANGGIRAGGSYGALLVRKAELEAQLKGYLEQYTEKNPKVVAARNQLAEIERQIVALEKTSEPDAAIASTPQAAELRTLQREFARLNAELEVTKRELARREEALKRNPSADVATGSVAPPIGPATDTNAGKTQVDLEYDRLRTQYEILLHRQDAVRRTWASAAGTNSALFQLIEPPNLPASPSGPDRFRLQLYALVLAIGASLLVLAALELRRLPMIYSDRDIEYYLGVPVLAQIPESLSVAENNRRRTVTVAQGVGVMLLGAALIPVLVFLLNTLEVFKILAR